jgi:hypothetical protein
MIYAKYEEGNGRELAAYDPRRMVRLLIYGQIKEQRGFRRFLLRGVETSGSGLAPDLGHAQSAETLSVGMECAEGMKEGKLAAPLTSRAALADSKA